jgi:hypothetical protein
VAGAQEALQRVNTEISVAQADLQTYVEAANEFQKGLIGDQTEFIATYSSSTRTLMSTAEDFLSGISDSYSTSVADYLTRVTGAINTSISDIYNAPVRTIDPATGRPPASGPQERFQSGFIGTANQPGPGVQFTAGEASAEKVAVLAQPRQETGSVSGQITFGRAEGREVAIVEAPSRMRDIGAKQAGYVGLAGAAAMVTSRVPEQSRAPWALTNAGGGMTNVSFVIHVHNPVVRKDEDITILSRSIADQVEQRLSRRTSLLGLRPS